MQYKRALEIGQSLTEPSFIPKILWLISQRINIYYFSVYGRYIPSIRKVVLSGISS